MSCNIPVTGESPEFIQQPWRVQGELEEPSFLFAEIFYPPQWVNLKPLKEKKTSLIGGFGQECSSQRDRG